MNPFANLNIPNAGATFMEAFKQGRAERKERDTNNALMQYMAPGIVQGDQTSQQADQALQTIMQNNPQMGMQLMQQRQSQQKAALEQHRESIMAGAKIIRQINPQDDAGWQQVLQLAHQVGIDLADVPQQFDPQYVQGLIKVADALEPQKDNSPSAVREWEFRQSLQPEQQAAFDRFRQSIRPQIFGSAEGGYNIYDPNNQGGQDMPSVSTPQEAMQLPPGTQFRLPDGRIGTVPGGAGGNASGGFPVEH